jgi:membrane protein implicated in regulation of membrane protease activity
MAIYLGSMLIGGVLVALSVLGGDHGHHDVGGDGADGHAGDHGSGVADTVLAWLPLGSFRFWTFFAAFFGLTGTALTMLGTSSPVVVGAAVAVGYASGLMLTRALRRLQVTTDSSLGEADLVGASAQVLLPVGGGRTGKVRLQIKGRTVDLLAETEEAAMAAGERVLVIAAPAGGHVVVARAPV